MCVGDCSTSEVSVANGYGFALCYPTLFCVGKCAFVYFFSVVAVMNILSDFYLSSTEFYALQFPLFLSLFMLHQRNCLYRLLLTSAAPLRLDLDPINAILCDSDTGGATAEDP